MNPSYPAPNRNGSSHVTRFVSAPRSGDRAEFAPTLGGWLKVTESRGADAVRQVYLDTLAGRIPPDQGHMLSLAE
jgi:hypothetical protein